MTPDDDIIRERAEPVPQHHARLDDPSSPATSVAREAAERFAIEAAQRRMAGGDPTSAPDGGSAQHASRSLRQARSRLQHADDDVRALESQLREGRAAAGGEAPAAVPTRQGRARGRGKKAGGKGAPS